MTPDERKARNQVAFREANERTRATRDSLPLADAPLPLICECDRPACTVVLQIQAVEYERVRQKGTRFLVATGHDDGTNPVVATGDGYAVIDKTGIEGAIAADEDPRRHS